MSDSPCTACRSTSNGRLFYVYVNHYVGEDLEKRRARLCRDCVVDVLPPLLDGADYLENREWLTTEQFARSVSTAIAMPAGNSSPEDRTILTNSQSTHPSTSSSVGVAPQPSPLPPSPLSAPANGQALSRQAERSSRRRGKAT